MNGSRVTRHPSLVSLLGAAVLLATACSGTAVVQPDGPDGIPLPPVVEVQRHQRDVTALAVSPDGRTLATVSADSIHLWDAATMAPLAVLDAIPRLEFHGGVAVANDAQRVAVLNEYMELHVWERDTFESRVPEIRWGQGPRELVGFTADDSLFWISVEDELVQWRPRPDDESRDTVSAVADLSYFSRAEPGPDGRYLIWARVPSRLEVDAEHRARLEPLTGEAVPEGRRTAGRIPRPVGEHGERLLVGDDDALELLDPRSGQRTPLTTDLPRARQGGDDVLVAVDVSPDGGTLALGWRSGGLELWDVAEARLRASLLLDERYVRAVHPTPILDLAMTVDGLVVLLPEQRALRLAAPEWVVVEEHML